MFALASSAFAQSPASSGGGRHEIFAGSELENYLRYLQSMDTANLYPWSLRPFSPSEVDHILATKNGGPWAGRYDLAPSRGSVFEAQLIPPTVSERFNSAFPYGYNDGPIWAGRGLTTAAQAGFFLRAGPLSLTVAPMVFRAENTPFALQPVSLACPPNCRDAIFGTQVDRPQRFGNTAYQRFDPGQSTLRLDALGASVGLTTANEWWGPTADYPFLLGNNAPGFPHLFVGTERPVNVLVGRVNARVIYGRLDQSDFSPVTGSKYFLSLAQPGRVRFASGLVASFEPRGLTGLEIGGGRFFQSPWPSTGIPRAYLVDPFRAAFRSSADSSLFQKNQLASVFYRWVFPHSGLETYGEYGRDDFNYDFRDLTQEPDHARTYSLGLRKVFHIQSDRFDAFHFELMNYQLPPLARLLRGEGVIYAHLAIPQGHTNRGQLLGSPLGVGSAAGSSLGWNRYSAHGMTSVTWQRVVSQESGTFYNYGVLNPRSSDVSHSLAVERVVFLRSFDLTSGVTVTREFNRDFTNDAWNLNALLLARFHRP
jgi:hypothetical protein